MNKNLLFLLIFCQSFSLTFSQEAITTESSKSKDELNCYNKWANKFEERGAEDVKDGVYTDVIISVRYKGSATCYSGKVEVIDGKINKFYILLEDGTYEEFKKSWKNNSNKDRKIINGISETMITIHNELVNVLFPSKLKPKKPKPKLAPEPTDD
ncbi:MAG: hypothetical protein KatS3mg027_1580 [Bacteroidia bacterium]|nr:MAG: hypothetical protein KatS3mg027_1580 [Bacteroidia bacterium]